MRAARACLVAILCALASGACGQEVAASSSAVDAGFDAGGAVDGSRADGGAPIDGGSVDGASDAGEVGDAMADAGLRTRIDDAISSIQGDTCFAQADTTLCEWADYEVGPAEFNMASSTGEAVLVIDSFGEGFFPELVRYRNRLRGFYRINGDSVELQVLSVHLPKRLGDVLVSFAGPEFIPASALSDVASATSSVYGKLNLLYYGHGGVVFAHLAELVPEQPLVLLEMTNLLDVPPVVCAGIDDATLGAARAHFVAVSASLKAIMTEHNVRFINASFGSTAATMAESWTRVCGSALPSAEQLLQLLHVYDGVYELLFHSEGVIAAHAAANLGSPADYPFDQVGPQYANRVRVGFISSLSSGLDPVGRGAVSKVEQFPADGDADVYFNWGCQPLGACVEPHYQFAGNFGLGGATLPIMSTSYITPLGVARLVNLRYANHGAEAMSDGLVQTLRQELTPALCGADGAQPCVYQDPIAHEQLESHRLGYE